MYFVVAFRDNKIDSPGHIQIVKKWIKDEAQVVLLVQEGYTVYRSGTDQCAVKLADDVVWYDLKETKDGQD